MFIRHRLKFIHNFTTKGAGNGVSLWLRFRLEAIVAVQDSFLFDDQSPQKLPLEWKDEFPR